MSHWHDKTRKTPRAERLDARAMSRDETIAHLERFGRDARAIPFTLDMSLLRAYHLAGLLQLVLRHPLLPKLSRDTAEEVVRQIERVVRSYDPTAGALLELGDDPTQDVERA